MTANKPTIAEATQKATDFEAMVVMVNCEISSLYLWWLPTYRTTPTLLLKQFIVLGKGYAIRFLKVSVSVTLPSLRQFHSQGSG